MHTAEKKSLTWVNLIGLRLCGPGGWALAGIKDGVFNGADNLLAPFKPTWQERFREFESISAVGY